MFLWNPYHKAAGQKLLYHSVLNTQTWTTSINKLHFSWILSWNLYHKGTGQTFFILFYLVLCLLVTTGLEISCLLFLCIFIIPETEKPLNIQCLLFWLRFKLEETLLSLRDVWSIIFIILVVMLFRVKYVLVVFPTEASFFWF